VGLAFFSVQAYAALPPSTQNIRDISVMMEFVQHFPGVASTFLSLDLYHKVIVFDKNCYVFFDREKISQNSNRRIGAVPDLEAVYTNCSLSNYK